jgi:hypothetical protein
LHLRQALKTLFGFIFYSILTLSWSVPYLLVNARAAEPALEQLSDQEFWQLISDCSEPDGTFISENLVSNEIGFQRIIPELARTAKKQRAYLGVGSEQNFSYIAAVRPSIAFIFDIRRGNLDLHLAYKALFEMSTGRVDFVSRLFSRKLPEGLNASSTVSEIFAALRKAAPDRALFEKNLKEIQSHLMTRHGFNLSKGDLEGIGFVYGSWFQSGPGITYELTIPVLGLDGRTVLPSAFAGIFPTYEALMTATDGGGKNQSFLATESEFRIIKDLESRNRIVPIVGNFGGPKALRAIGAWLKKQKLTVSIFYTSNVEQYLQADGIWGTFCSNVREIPVDDASLFIRSAISGYKTEKPVPVPSFEQKLVPIKPEILSCTGP